MGLTSRSSGISLLHEELNINNSDNPVIALAGNPNTGKSTVFNGLTGLNQHTGNWPGKTVTQAKGFFEYQNQKFTIIDLPGAYSLLANSTEEKIARDFICFGRPDITIVVVDATNLERNLNLALQVMELTKNTIICLNLMDEAERKNIKINIEGLRKDLGIPVIPTVAREKKGFSKLKKTIFNLINNDIELSPLQIKYSEKIENDIAKIVDQLNGIFANNENRLNLHWLALRLLEGDKSIINYIDKILMTKKINNLYFEKEVFAPDEINSI